MEIKTPVTILNFKAYPQGSGLEALTLAKICKEVADETGKEIIAAVQAADIYRITSQVPDLKVFAQHLDGVEQGAKTGWVTAEAIKAAGAIGTLINHSEKQLSSEDIEKAVARAKENGLSVVICADTPAKSGEVAQFSPDFIAIEPPELIGSGVSVSTAKPEIVTDAISKVNSVADIPVLCGAGITNTEDVKKAIELGVKGVLLASGVVKADDQKKALLDIVNGMS